MCTLGVVIKNFRQTESYSRTKKNRFQRLCSSGPSGKPNDIALGDQMQMQEAVPKTSGKKLKNKRKNASSQLSPQNSESSQAIASASSPKPELSAHLYEMRGHLQQTVENMF